MRHLSTMILPKTLYISSSILTFSAIIQFVISEQAFAGSHIAYSHCLYFDAGESRIENRCDRAVEAIWEDFDGGRNMVTIPAMGGFPTRNVKFLYACPPNTGYDWDRSSCRSQ
jgi:hypothetical protein